MSYLLDFAKTLTEEERIAFAQIPLPPKESAIRLPYLNPQQLTKQKEQKLPVQLGVSKSFFDKTTSLLLDKTLAHFAATDFWAKMKWLHHKQLFHLLLHELKLEEKRLQKTTSKKELKLFYLHAFNIVRLFNFNDFPEDKLNYYCNHYIKLLNNEEEEKLVVQSVLQNVLIHYHNHRSSGSAFRKKSAALLHRFLKVAIANNFVLAQVHIHIAFSAISELLQADEAITHLQEAQRLALLIPEKVERRTQIYLLVMLADLLAERNDFNTSISYYKQAFDSFPEILKLKMYHPYNYCFVLLCAGKTKEAEKNLKQFIAPFLENNLASNNHFDILRLYAIFYLLHNETAKAGKFLQQLLQFPKDDFTPLGDLLLRFVHNVYCLQVNDFALAQSMLKKNMKFIDSKPDLIDFATYRKFFLALGKAIRFKASKKQLSSNFFEEYDIDYSGKKRVYLNLVLNALK